MSLVSLKKSRRSSHRRATIAMTAWPTRHTAADWHPTAKGQFRQMTRFRESFPYVFSIGYRHVRYVYSQLARTAPNEKSLPTFLFEHPQKGTPPLQWRAPNRAPLGSERREALFGNHAHPDIEVPVLIIGQWVGLMHGPPIDVGREHIGARGGTIRAIVRHIGLENRLG